MRAPACRPALLRGPRIDPALPPWPQLRKAVCLQAGCVGHCTLTHVSGRRASIYSFPKWKHSFLEGNVSFLKAVLNRSVLLSKLSASFGGREYKNLKLRLIPRKKV